MKSGQIPAWKQRCGPGGRGVEEVRERPISRNQCSIPTIWLAAGDSGATLSGSYRVQHRALRDAITREGRPPNQKGDLFAVCGPFGTQVGAFSRLTSAVFGSARAVAAARCRFALSEKPGAYVRSCNVWTGKRESTPEQVEPPTESPPAYGIDAGGFFHSPRNHRLCRGFSLTALRCSGRLGCRDDAMGRES
jgi:hypothetical protein